MSHLYMLSRLDSLRYYYYRGWLTALFLKQETFLAINIPSPNLSKGALLCSILINQMYQIMCTNLLALTLIKRANY